MRLLKRALRALILLAGFLAALWAFMPWREVGSFAMALAASRMERQGMTLTYSGVEDVRGGFSVRDVTLSGFTRFSCASMTLRPDLLASLALLAPVCEVAFSRGSLTMGQPMAFGDGRFLLTASPTEVSFEELRTDGDFRIRGFLTLDLGRMKIGRAEAELLVPEAFEENMETLRNFLPLEKEGDGRWFLRRSRPEGGSAS
ncbi:hypothetical protein [uncultured Fretibacterium sp.]|uniref:hypothetical protein n=1 Tax=uncultured Fretibacterium sp. TaxID=1678694 RepID=UPI00262F39C7|nr:hypothetical protein [uncultured Fretibacterium sp.]